ncbi:MAG: carboxypeptidase-like regulatory domain-containing protein [Planctomycetes bacterium]|nr:carboxypeptidase-like regulatory domain-containing protein [Planctomycetota bacterium]
MIRRAVAGGSVLLSIALLVGCGGASTPSTSKVTGTVKYNNAPLANVNVTFTPQEGRPATGTTDAEGHFQLTTFEVDDGAVPGMHRVTITPGPSSEPPPMPESPEQAKAAPPAAPFPAKYMHPDQSGLTANVESGKSCEFTFELTD